MRVIPVEKMALILLHAVQRREGALQTCRQLQDVRVTHIVSRERGQQIQSDVRGRCAVGHESFRRLLKVVRRQPVVLGPHEALEEEPRTARDAP